MCDPRGDGVPQNARCRSLYSPAKLHRCSYNLSQSCSPRLAAGGRCHSSLSGPVGLSSLGSMCPQRPGTSVVLTRRQGRPQLCWCWRLAEQRVPAAHWWWGGKPRGWYKQMDSLKDRSFMSCLTVVILKKKPQRRKDAWLVSDTSRASTFLAPVEMDSPRYPFPRRSPPDDHPCWPSTWCGIKKDHLCPTAFMAVSLSANRPIAVLCSNSQAPWQETIRRSETK